jgi:hypothetical protein
MTALIWVANGFLALVFFLVDHLAALGVLASGVVFLSRTSAEQRSWAAGVSLLVFGTSMFAPFPVPYFVLLLAAGGQVAVYFERYNPAAARWNLIRVLGLYGLAGGAYAIYRLTGLADRLFADPMMSQGAGYFNAIFGIIMYAFPIGALVYMAQSVFAHPPALARPETLITQVRTRGKE